jgi:hypothetical protein
VRVQLLARRYHKELELIFTQISSISVKFRVQTRELRRSRARVTRESRTKTVTRATMKVVDFVLEDGSYDAFVVWADALDDVHDDVHDDAHDAHDVAIELTITTGAHRGEVVSVRVQNLRRDALDLVGLPCTLHVSAGQPRISW